MNDEQVDRLFKAVEIVKEHDMRNETKTLSMRLQHVFFELSSLVVELRNSSKHPTSKKYYDFFAHVLEKKIELMKRDIEKINYLEVE